ARYCVLTWATFGFFDDVHCRRQLHRRFTSRCKIRARSTDQVGGKRLRNQAADWISPVNAARTASSRSASVKARCSCSRAMTRSTKTPRVSNGTRSAATQPARSCEWVIANPMRPLTSLPKRSEGRSRLSDQRIIVVQAQIGVLRSSVNCWTSLGLLLRPEIDIDIHSGDQRTGFVQVDHHLVDIEIGQIARSR